MAKLEYDGCHITFIAKNDIAQGVAVTIDTDGKVLAPAATTFKVVGVTAHEALAGKRVAVVTGGVHNLAAAAVTAPGTRCQIDANGKLVAAADTAPAAFMTITNAAAVNDVVQAIHLGRV